jgi:hypothetical protein
VVTARLQRDVGVCTTGGLTGSTEGKNLRMRFTRSLVIPLSHDAPIVDDHAPDERIGRSAASTALGKRDGTTQMGILNPRCDV